MNEQNSPTIPPLLGSFSQRLLYWIFIPVAPIVNFSFVSAMLPLWQTGKFSDYMLLMLSPEAAALTLPLLGYSVISYLMLISDEERQSESLVIRFGIYGGVLLSFHYSLLTALSMDLSPVLFGFVFFIFLPLLIPKLRAWLQNEKVFRALIFAAFAILVLWGIVAAVFDYSTSPVLLLVILVPMSAPFWCFFIALQTARWLWKYHEPKLTHAHGFGLFTWLSAYGVALYYNITKMYELYATLPTQPPNCYIATAAANGHSAFVGSQEIRLENGISMRVNRQLQNLKCAELALMVIAPHLHKILRSVYDLFGKALARRIQNPLLADAAYISLKPFEWTAVAVLELIVPNWDDLASKIYIR